MIKFSDQKSSSTFLDITQLDNYLGEIAQQNRLSHGYNIPVQSKGYVVFGQTGGRKLLPDNQNDLSNLIKLDVIPSQGTSDYNILNSSDSLDVYKKSARYQIEGILSKYELWFTYDMETEEQPFGMTITNEYGNEIESLVNNLLSGPMHDLLGMIGSTKVTKQIFNEVSKYFHLNVGGGDLYSVLFLSKIKQIKVWQNGELTFNLPLKFKFRTLGNEYSSEQDFVYDSITNVVFPTYLLQLMQGYHEAPNILHISSDSKWVKILNNLIRVIIGPLNFKVQIGQFFSTDDNSPLQIERLDISYGNLINGYPTSQEQELKIVNINPIILDSVPPYGSDQIQPQRSNTTFYANFNSFR